MKGIRFSIIRTIVAKEFKEIFREKKMRGVLFGAPIGMLLMFGYAVNTDVSNIAMAVYDEDKTATSRATISRFTGSGYFHYYADLKSEREMAPLLDSGKADLLLRIERGFGDKIRANESAAVQVIIDGADSSRASVISAYVNEILSTIYFEKMKSTIQAQMLALQSAQKASDPLSPEINTGNPGFHLAQAVELRERSFFNPMLSSRNFSSPRLSFSWSRW